MKLFKVPAGTQARALRESGSGIVTVEEVVLKAEAIYEIEEIAVDPIGNVGDVRLQDQAIGGDYARAGWYGFRLPRNDRGFRTLLVPMSSVEVMC